MLEGATDPSILAYKDLGSVDLCMRPGSRYRRYQLEICGMRGRVVPVGHKLTPVSRFSLPSRRVAARFIKRPRRLLRDGWAVIEKG